MTKLAAVALVCLATCLGVARAAPSDGKPVPLFPQLNWGLSAQAALSKGLKTYARGDSKDVVGLPSVAIGDIDFSARAIFGKADAGGVPPGLKTIVLEHDGFVPKGQYEKFIRHITKGFLYAGKGSVVGESALFYNAVDRGSHLVVTNTVGSKTTLIVEVAPGITK